RFRSAFSGRGRREDPAPAPAWERSSSGRARGSRYRSGMRLRLLGSILPVLAGCCALPAVLIALVGRRMIMPPMWVHFYGVGVTALVATAAAVALTTIGARQGDVRTVVIGGGFSLMAALLAVHGLATPGVILGTNGLIAISGGITLPVGGAVPAFCALPRLAAATAVPRLVALQTP